MPHKLRNALVGWGTAIMLCTGFEQANPVQAFDSGHAVNDVFISVVPQASIVGRGTLSYAFWNIYDATLYAPDGRLDRTQPFALSLHYHRALNGHDIADRTVKEIRKQGFDDEIRLAAWNAQLKTIFPDVVRGTTLSAIHHPGQGTVFYKDDTVIGTVRGDDFATAFFDIWLGDGTSHPALRRALLGLS